MGIHRGHVTARLAGAATVALLLAGCSAESIMESALEQVDGVGEVDFDAEGGSFSVTDEDGEEFGVDVDPETGESTLRAGEEEVTTSPTDEVPAEIAAAVTLPEAFTPVSMSRSDVDGGVQTMLQGEISGDFDALFAEIEQGVAAAGWSHVEPNPMVPGQQGMVIGQHDEDGEVGVMVSLTLGEETGDDGMLQVILLEE